jgi:stress-induced morphogen
MCWRKDCEEKKFLFAVFFPAKSLAIKNVLEKRLRRKIFALKIDTHTTLQKP